MRSQILTDIAVLEVANSAVQAEELGKKGVDRLLAKQTELLAAIKSSKGKIKLCKDTVSELRKQIQAESESSAAKLGQTKDSPLQFYLQEALIQLENAHADPAVHSERISVAQETFLLLGLITKADKEYEAAVDALCSKSQARLHSQVPVQMLIHHDSRNMI